jgi:hypothetical protein
MALRRIDPQEVSVSAKAKAKAELPSADAAGLLSFAGPKES